MPKPHELFKVWSPDEVAECLPGTGLGELYNALWALSVHYDDLPRSEVPDDFSTRALANWWDELSEQHQEELNILAEIHDRATV